MMMRIRVPLVVLILCSMVSALAARQQRSPDARRVAVEWLTAKTVAGAVKHLPAGAVEQIRKFQKSATGDAQEVAGMLEVVLAPLAVFTERGATVTTKGQPIQSVTLADGPTPDPLEFTLGAEQVKGDLVRVPVTIVAADQAPESGFIDVRRSGGAWRVVGAHLGSELQLPSYEEPNFLHAASSFLVDSLEREQVRSLRHSAVGALRLMKSAEESAAESNAGYFVGLECLEAPAKCKLGFSQPMLPPGRLAPRMYDGQFVAGVRLSAAELRKGKAVAQSIKTWAYILHPTADAFPQLPALCGDSTGRMCVVPRGTTATGGACPATCEPIK